MSDGIYWNRLLQQERDQEKGEAAWQNAFEQSMYGLEHDFIKQSDMMELLHNHTDKSCDERQFGHRMMAALFVVKNARTEADFKKAQELAKDVIYDMASFQADQI